MITETSSIQLLKFWLLNFSDFQMTFFKKFMKKLSGFKIYFERSDKVLPLTNIYNVTFLDNETTTLFFFFLLKSVLLLQFCNFVKWGNIKTSILQILVLLWAILTEIKVSQVGCFQITDRWICYLFFPISHL